MATTSFATTSASVVKLWSERCLHDFVTDTEMLSQMMKAGTIRREDQTSRSAGDRITMSFRRRLTDAGLLGMQTATGLESSLDFFTDNINIDQLREVVSNPNTNTIDAQRVQYNFPEETYMALSEWMKTRGILGAFNQLAGNTATSISYDGIAYTGNDRLKITGLNAATAPTTTSGVTRIIRPNALTTDQAVGADTTATAKLTDILQCETYAATQRPYIRPLSENSGIKYHYYCHTQSYMDLMTDASSSLQYRDFWQALITSGRGEGLMERSFDFSQTRVFCSDKIPNGVDSSTSAAVANTRRNIFTGRDAGAICFGKGFSSGKGDDVAGFMMREDYLDVQQIQRISIVGIFGIKKIVFDSNDNAVIVSVNYSAI